MIEACFPSFYSEAERHVISPEIVYIENLQEAEIDGKGE